MKVTVMSSDASVGFSFKDKEEANIQSSRDAFAHILLTEVWHPSTTGKIKSVTPVSSPPHFTCMFSHRSRTAGGGSSSSGGVGDGAGEGDSGGRNRNDPPTPPHAHDGEGKVKQRCFNDRNNTTLNVWMKGSNGKRYQVQSKEDVRREILRRRTANSARRVNYERQLGKLSPLWREWSDACVKKVTSDAVDKVREEIGRASYPHHMHMTVKGRSNSVASTAGTTRH